MRAVILLALIFPIRVFSSGLTGWDDVASTVGLPGVTPAPDLDVADVSLEGIYADDDEGVYDDDDDYDDGEEYEDEDEDEDEDGEDYEDEDEEDDDAYDDLYDGETETENNPHPRDKIPQYRYKDPGSFQYNHQEVAYNFPHVLNQSIPIDETPIDIDEDIVKARLGRRHNIGGLYYCKKDGQCQYRDGKFNKCYNLPQTWRDQVVTFKAERHDFVCTTCAEVDCHRCSQWMSFPGSSHVKKHSIRSYICLPWDTTPSDSMGTGENMADLEESFTRSKRANVQRDPMRLHGVPSNGVLNYRDGPGKAKIRSIAALGKCHAIDEHAHRIKAVKITVNDKFRMRCRIYSKPNCQGEHYGGAGFAMYHERWNVKHLGWKSIPSYRCIPYYVDWKDANHGSSSAGHDTAATGPGKSTSWPTVDSILIHWQKDNVRHKRHIKTLGECHQFKPKNPPIQRLSLSMEGNHVQCLVYGKDFCQGKGAWLGPSMRHTSLIDGQPRKLHFDDFRSFKCDWGIVKFKKKHGFIGKPDSGGSGSPSKLRRGEEEGVDEIVDEEDMAYIPYGPEEEEDENYGDDDSDD